MATSGTIGTTRINTAKLLEKCLRRIGLNPQNLAPEIVTSAQEDLFMLLMSLSNRGLNLWCIDKQLITLAPGQSGYDLPVGTLNILNLLQASPSLSTSDSTSSTATSYTSIFTEPTKLVRYGVRFSQVPVSFDLQGSLDGVLWETIQSVTAVTGLQWYDVDPEANFSYYKISSVDPLVVDTLYLANSVREIAVSQFNRDDYANQPNKTFTSGLVTSFYFEKLINPRIQTWPVPNDEINHLVLFRHRQPQDVGTLTQEIEIPSRWYEAITWQWSVRLAFELPGVDPARRAEVIQMAGQMMAEVEGGETDEAPIYFAPRIGCYTR